MSNRSWLLVLIGSIAAAAGLILLVGDGGGVFQLADAPVGHGDGPASAQEFPRTFTDFHGFEVTLPAPPQRIASQALPTDQFLFALLPPQRIVAVSDFAASPQYSNIVDLVRRHKIPPIRDAEYAIRLDPDLLLVSSISRADFTDLVRQGGVPTFTLETVFNSLDEIKAGIAHVGELTGEREAAERVISEFEARIERAIAMRRPSSGSAPPRILALSSFAYSYGKGSLFEDIVTRLGGANVGSEYGLAEWGKVSNEQIAGWDPDWIVSGTGGAPIAEVRRKLLADPAVRATTAGRLEQIVVLEDRHYLTMSQHVIHLIEALADALYGAR